MNLLPKKSYKDPAAIGVVKKTLRKNPSHPLCGWSVTRNIIMESGINTGMG